MNNNLCAFDVASREASTDGAPSTWTDVVMILLIMMTMIMMIITIIIVSSNSNTINV